MSVGIRNLSKPTPKKLVRLAWALKTTIGGAGIASLFGEKMHWLTMACFIATFLSDFIINLFADDTTSYTPDLPPKP